MLWSKIARVWNHVWDKCREGVWYLLLLHWLGFQNFIESLSLIFLLNHIFGVYNVLLSLRRKVLRIKLDQLLRLAVALTRPSASFCVLKLVSFAIKEIFINRVVVAILA